MSSETPPKGPARSMLYDPTERRIKSFVTRAGRPVIDRRFEVTL